MTKRARGNEPKKKGKSGKLKLNKETVKDLDPQDPSGLKGGAIRTNNCPTPTESCFTCFLTCWCTLKAG